MRQGTGFLIAACAVVVVGCGSDRESNQQEDEVRAALRNFVRNVAGRDYDEVCRIVTKEVRASWADFARRNPKHFSTAGCPAFAQDFYRGSDIGQRTLRQDMTAIERGSIRIRGNEAIFTADRRDRRAGKDDTTHLKKISGRWLLGG